MDGGTTLHQCLWVWILHGRGILETDYAPTPQLPSGYVFMFICVFNIRHTYNCPSTTITTITTTHTHTHRSSSRIPQTVQPCLPDWFEEGRLKYCYKRGLLTHLLCTRLVPFSPVLKCVLYVALDGSGGAETRPA